jgi:hypothetical protein
MEEIKKIYFKYRTEAVEARAETKMYKDLLKTLLSYVYFGDKSKLEISPMNVTVFNLFKTLKNDLNLLTITDNDEFMLRNKTTEELIALKNKINHLLKKK